MNFTQELLPAFERLDHLLGHALQRVEEAYGPQAAADPFRGLHLSHAQVTHDLTHPPGAPRLYVGPNGNSTSPPTPGPHNFRLARLKTLFDLSDFDLDVLLLALAPELDRRYERLYAYLQDHVAHTRPTVDLALHLLCSDATERLARRAHFDPQAPLIHNRLLHLLAPDDHPQPSLLAHNLRLDELVVRHLLGQDGADERLSACAHLATARPLPPGREYLQPIADAVARLLAAAHQPGQPWALVFTGPQGSARRLTARAAAMIAGVQLLVVDLEQAQHHPLGLARIIELGALHTRLAGGWLYLEAADRTMENAPTNGRLSHPATALRGVVAALARFRVPALLSTTRPWMPAQELPGGAIPVDVPPPTFDQRRGILQADLETLGASFPATDLEALASRFRFTPAQIRATVTAAHNHARWRAALASPAGDGTPPAPFMSTADLFRAARAQTGHRLATLTHKIDPRYTWEHIVLPPESLTQLQEICQRLTHRHTVLGAWGFGARLSLGKGVNALFAGPSGTGKTMAAEIIANALGLDLYRIDLAGVVSKYIGETEKNLDQIFAAAESANAILFFDEADALFGKRSEVRDSHDRYANIEISYLLQRMEAYEGLSILATNLRQNLDEAFVRRLTFTVHFPFPDRDSRRRIWEKIWPPETPLAPNLDFDFLAARFKLSGGNIKNAALAAAYLAAEAGAPVSMEHLRQAVRREYQKMGKSLSEADLHGAETAARENVAAPAGGQV